MSPKQKKLAGKAPPPNKLDEKDFAVLRAEKAKGRGMGLQDESKKPGKIYKAALGVMAMKKAKDKGAKGAEFLSPVMLAKRLFKKKSGGVMKYKRGSGLHLPVISSVPPAVHKTKKTQKTAVMKEQFNKQKSRTLDYAKKKGLPIPFSLVGKGVQATPLPGRLKLLKSLGKLPFVKGIGKKDVKKKMGGGMMMQRPMGYKSGMGPSGAAGFKSKQDRKKAEKNIKEARSTEGLRSFLSGRTNPMRKDRYMEGRKARHTEFKKKLGKSALGVLGSLIPGAAAAKVAKKVLGRGDKKRDFQKGDYGDISVKKNMGGMMMQRPMGYSKGVSVKARGCKLGRNKPTKIT